MSRECPCGLGNPYEECCGVYIDGDKNAATPEALMRSRYTAYSTQKIDYIEKTMKEAALEHFDKQSSLEWASKAKWLGLTVISAKTNNEIGFVEFIARYQLDNKDHSIHELSRFKKIAGLWYYVDGKHVETKRFT